MESVGQQAIGMRKVRFGSLADIAAALLNVRFTPNADIAGNCCDVR